MKRRKKLKAIIDALVWILIYLIWAALVFVGEGLLMPYIGK